MNIRELAHQDQAAWNDVTQPLYDEIDRVRAENERLHIGRCLPQAF